MDPPEIVNLPQHLGPPPQPPEASPPPRRRQRVWVNVVLFALTFLSALMSQLAVRADESFAQILLIPMLQPWRLIPGLPFALTLMSILLAHEMGHYLTAQRYGVDQSLPYFIPAPTMFGTLGAVILMRSQPRDRRVLLNVAVMGPYAGLVIAIPAAAWGLAHSLPVYDTIDNVVGASIVFGDSILFRALEHMFSPNGTDVILHPVAMAGWVGLFITSLNLIPAAQLDGGHVAYALFGKNQEKLSLAVVAVLLSCGMMISLLGDYAPDGGSKGGEMWILWALLLFVVGIRHPPVQDETVPLTARQRFNGMFALLVFILTFIPIPVRVVAASRALPSIETMPPGEPGGDPNGEGDDGGDDDGNDGDGDGDGRRQQFRGAPRPHRPDGAPAEEFRL